MTLVYQSTRDAKNTVTASQAILQGLATAGGFVFCLLFQNGEGLPERDKLFQVASR